MKSRCNLFLFFLCLLFYMNASVFANTRVPVDVCKNISMNDSASEQIGNVIKNGLRFIHNFGSDNTFIGIRAGKLGGTVTGFSNVGFGTNALRMNSAGRNNIAVGKDALTKNINGNSNTAVGQAALLSNTVDNNTAIGKGALTLNTTGQNNAAFGREALNANTIGNDNTAVGYQSLAKNTEGDSNTAVGVMTLQNNIAGDNNTAIGKGALNANKNGMNNTAIGRNALAKHMVGNNNTAIGKDALLSLTGGISNTAIGTLAGKNVVSSIKVRSDGNIFLGYQAGLNLKTGNNNIYIGSPGVTQESGIIRIGQIGRQTRFILPAAVRVLQGAASMVSISSVGILGVMPSSRKFQHTIKNINGDESERIYDLNPVTFIYNDDEKAERQYGLIAEEVYRVLPNIVIEDDNNDPYSIRYEILSVLLLNELKKQKKNMHVQQCMLDEHERTMNMLKKVVVVLQAQIQQAHG